MLTINELSVRYNIDIEKLRAFEKSGLITTLEEFDDVALKRLILYGTLYDSGLSLGDIKRFLILNNDGKSTEQIRLLNLYRQNLLDEIHKKQKSLDCLDYIIYEIKNKTKLFF